MKVSLREQFLSYTIRKLEIGERVKSFDCGDADLNDFILNSSNDYRKSRRGGHLGLVDKK